MGPADTWIEVTRPGPDIDRGISNSAGESFGQMLRDPRDQFASTRTEVKQIKRSRLAEVSIDPDHDLGKRPGEEGTHVY